MYVGLYLSPGNNKTKENRGIARSPYLVMNKYN